MRDLILFTANDCGACSIFKASILPQLKQKLQGRRDVNFKEVNLQSIRSQLPSEYQRYRPWIGFYPTLMLTNGTSANVFNGRKSGNIMETTKEYKTNLQGILEWLDKGLKSGSVPEERPSFSESEGFVMPKGVPHRIGNSGSSKSKNVTSSLSNSSSSTSGYQDGLVKVHRSIKYSSRHSRSN
ncbi:hypothetical protein D3C87_879800 [compost metagenome]